MIVLPFRISRSNGYFNLLGTWAFWVSPGWCLYWVVRLVVSPSLWSRYLALHWLCFSAWTALWLFLAGFHCHLDLVLPLAAAKPFTSCSYFCFSSLALCRCQIAGVLEWVRISGCWFNGWIFSAVRLLNSLRLSPVLLQGWSLSHLLHPLLSWWATTWIIEHLLWPVTAACLPLWLLAVLYTTSWPLRSQLFLRLWCVIALSCLVVALPLFSEQREPGRLVIGPVSALKEGFNDQGPLLVSTWRTSATLYSVPLDSRCPYLPSGQPTTGTSWEISSPILSHTAFLPRKKLESTVQQLESFSQRGHGNYLRPAGEQYRRRSRGALHSFFSFGCAGGRGFRWLCPGDHEKRRWSSTWSSRRPDCYGGFADGFNGGSNFRSWSSCGGPSAWSQRGRGRPSFACKRPRHLACGRLRRCGCKPCPYGVVRSGSRFGSWISRGGVLSAGCGYVAEAYQGVGFFCYRRKSSVLLCGRRRTNRGASRCPKAEGEGQGRVRETKDSVRCKTGCIPHPADIQPSSKHGITASRDTGGAEEHERGFSSSEHAASTTGDTDPCHDAYAELCKDVGGTTEDKASYLCTASPQEGSSGSGLNSQCPRASRGGGGSTVVEESFGDGNVGAKQSVDHLGVASPEWRPSSGQSGSLIRHFLSWVPRKRKAAARAIAEERRILFSDHAERLQKDETSQPPSEHFGGACSCRFLDGSVYGAMRWLRKCQGLRHCAVCLELCGRFSNAVRLGGGAGTFVSSYACNRASGTGRRSLGFSIQPPVVGGPTSGDMDVPPQCHGGSDWPIQSFLLSMPSTHGNGVVGIHEGDGLYSWPQAGDGEEVCPRSPASPAAPKAKEKGEVPKRKTRCRDDEVAADPSDPVPMSKWINLLLRSVLATKTPFAAFVSRSIHCNFDRSSMPVHTALFPIPLPLDDAWSGVPSRLGIQRRRRLALRKLVRLVIVALNYLHARAPFSVGSAFVEEA